MKKHWSRKVYCEAYAYMGTGPHTRHVIARLNMLDDIGPTRTGQYIDTSGSPCHRETGAQISKH